MKTFKIKNKVAETTATEAQLAKLQSKSKMRIAKRLRKVKINGVLFKLADGKLKITEIKADAQTEAPVKKVPTKIVKEADLKQAGEVAEEVKAEQEEVTEQAPKESRRTLKRTTKSK